jgi:hypothetical protein
MAIDVQDVEHISLNWIGSWESARVKVERCFSTNKTPLYILRIERGGVINGAN